MDVLKMLAELRRRYEFRAASTDDLRLLAKEFVLPKSQAASIDGFFENWVYSTGIPTLKLKSTVSGVLSVTPSLRQARQRASFLVK